MTQAIFAVAGEQTMIVETVQRLFPLLEPERIGDHQQSIYFSNPIVFVDSVGKCHGKPTESATVEMELDESLLDLAQEGAALWIYSSG